MTDRRHTTWASSERFVPRNFIRPFVRFSRIEASSGIVLLVAALLAIVWANSPWSETYFSLLNEQLTIEFFGFHLEESVLELINDGLMAIFFFVVGLEIKRELVLGDLRDPRAAALPVMAALGGMIVPAGIYLILNSGAGAEAIRGWGIPMATDIAFALGVVALLGSRVPSGAKLFLLAVAIADDIGAIAVIAIFYTEDLNAPYLAAALGALALVWVGTKVTIRSNVFYVPVAFVAWYFLLESGVHATLAGVALGFITPVRPYYTPRQFDERARAILEQFPLESESAAAQEHSDHEALLLAEIATESVAPLNRLEHALIGWSSFLIIPIFALANAGVDFREVSLTEALTSSVATGVAVGLVLGKIIGVTGFTWLAVRLNLGKLPPRTGWSHILGLSAVAGIGFTVSLFIAGLAFTDSHLTDLAKVGIFTGSLVAGIIGALILSRSRPVES
ncbi:MAG: Na+/H+ antiporter NhaA [Actinomycetota bacterium]|nr:Na+/H+ antiporter NhaA [Actinomycetota bacterium]